MTEYLVICHSPYCASRLFKNLESWFRENRVSDCYFDRVFCGFSIELRSVGIIILFTAEVYRNIALRGFHGTVVSEYDVEKFLDEHKEGCR